MFFKRRKPGWLIDPSKVALGSVVESNSRNLSRSHVKVRYRKQTEVQFVAVALFFQRCRDLIRDGRSLGIEHLVVAPILKRRYAKFFESLTDWDPATRRVTRSLPAQQLSELSER